MAKKRPKQRMNYTNLSVGQEQILDNIQRKLNPLHTNKKHNLEKPKLGLIQHPMWFLVGEDSITASRTPPWGAADLDEYSKRIYRNLDSLQKNPPLKLNFDFSAVELEDLFEKYPDLGQRIKEFVQKGQIAFVNGTYSQPHLHTLSLESNIRQLQMGIRIIHELTGYRVQTHAMQEPDFSDQMVQILKAFGFRFATRGEFITGIITDSLCSTDKPNFYWWKGLDGSRIPLLSTVSLFAVDPLRDENITLPTFDGPIALKTPDMEEFEPDSKLDYVLLDEALSNQLKQFPPKSDARIFLPWGYVEGTQAEELMRENVLAEISLLQAETLEAMAPFWSRKPAAEMTVLWKRWLKAQHHDSYWADGPELRNKSIQWCKEARAGAEKMIQSRMDEFVSQDNSKRSSDGLLLFSINPCMFRQPVFISDWRGSVPVSMQSMDRKMYPVQVSQNGKQTEAFFLAGTEGVGFFPMISSKSVQKGTPVQKSLQSGWTYSNNYYSAKLDSDGSIQQVELQKGPKLIHMPVGQGGQLSAMPKYTNRIDRFEEHISSATIEHGKVADVVHVNGKIGPVKIQRCWYFYHELPWFETTLSCDFPDIELGDFAEDAYKLCFWWPAWIRNTLVHGIPGGAITPDNPEICFYPVNWMDLRSFNGDGGISIANWGTLKAFRRQGRIGLVLAWGTKENDFGNRTNAYWWAKKMDLKLKGSHTFRMAFYPHKGNWKEADIPHWANALLRPPVVYPTQLPQNITPLRRKFFHMQSTSLVPTAIYPDKESIRVRFFESKGMEPLAQFYRYNRKIAVKYYDVAGHRIRKLRPWIIGEAVLSIKGNPR